MRILIANDGFGDAGGVQTYLDAVIMNLTRRGHEIALAYCTRNGHIDASLACGPLTKFQVSGPGTNRALADAREWAPDICYSNNMDDVEVDRALGDVAPIVKFMHGYFGTCIGGLKTHTFPTPVACDRVYGAACAALYLPRHCGQRSPLAMVRQWKVAESHRRVRRVYAAYIVASEHMRREYVRNGFESSRVNANPLFSTEPVTPDILPVPDIPHVVFLGRMTPLKGGDLLVRAVHHAGARLGREIRLTMVGDGPARGEWEALAIRSGVPCEFTGWKTGADRWPLLRQASLVAVPSIWPEPFGLVGLEAAAFGVPAIAVNVGGIGEWLRDGVNGVAVAAPATPESFGAALADLLADRDRQAALRAGARQVAGEMTVDRHVDRLEAIFAQC